MSINIKGLTNFGPHIVTDGLVLYLDAANPKSYPGSGNITGVTYTPGIWYDLIGTNDLILYNSPTFETNHFILNGTNNYMSVNNATNLIMSTGTISYWLKKAEKDTNGGIFHIYEMGKGSSDYIRSYISSSNVMDLVIEDENLTKCNLTQDLDQLDESIWVNTWFNVVWTQTGNSIDLYINGKWIKNSINSWWTSHLINNSLVFTIGNAWAYLKGNISSFKIYNRSLSPSEVLQNFNALKSRYLL